MKLGSLKTLRLSDDSNQEALDFKVSAENFNGPFDVLLGLIDDGKIDLFAVSLTQITAAYLEYLKEHKNVSINSSAEFLFLAAYLIEMKSHALLPTPPAEEELIEDLESDLANRIQEYRVFKQLAHTLKDRKDIFEKVRYRYNENDVQAERPIVLVDVGLKDLISAFQGLWNEVSEKEEVREIEAEPITLEQRIDEVRNLIKSSSQGLHFRKLFTRWTKIELVVTFIAILELARQQFLRITQGDKFGDIILMEASNGKQESDRSAPVSDEGAA